MVGNGCRVLKLVRLFLVKLSPATFALFVFGVACQKKNSLALQLVSVHVLFVNLCDEAATRQRTCRRAGMAEEELSIITSV